MQHPKVLLFSALTIVLGSFPFYVQKINTAYTDISISNPKEIIHHNIDIVTAEISTLQQIAGNYQEGTETLKTLQKQLLKTRKAYKKVEFILEYFYPEHVKEYLNGAPLHHVDPNPIAEKFNTLTYYSTTPKEYANQIPLDHRDKDHFRGTTKVKSPVGLQVLDALIFSEEAVNEKQQIITLIEKLSFNFKTVERALKERRFLADFEMMEASRLQLVRVFTMGLTGFDTPGSLNAIEEAHAVFVSLNEIKMAFLTQTNSTQQRNKTTDLLEHAIAYLKKNRDFDSFDRLHFLINFINPLYKELLTNQKELGILSSAKKYGTTASWNADSENIFAADFLNPYYYSLLTEKEDSEALQKLGETLFYDTSLSKGGRLSCASCHKPELAFTDALPKSLASVQGLTVARNAPTLINAVYSDRYFYDLRAYDLEEQAEHVIASHLEFNTSFTEIINNISNNPAYVEAFKRVFEAKEKSINRSQLAAALASYLISLRSFNSPLDQYITGKTTTLPKDVKRGFNLFMGKANCATCHFAPTFSGLVPPLFQENESEVLGIFTHPKSLVIDADLGRQQNKIDLDNFSIYKNSFKTTSVRNAALTAPYFHNGGYATLEEVLDFYNQGGAAGMGFSYEVPNQTLAPDSLGLSKRDLQDLKAFIESLSDNPFSASKN